VQHGYKSKHTFAWLANLYYRFCRIKKLFCQFIDLWQLVDTMHEIKKLINQNLVVYYVLCILKRAVQYIVWNALMPWALCELCELVCSRKVLKGLICKYGLLLLCGSDPWSVFFTNPACNYYLCIAFFGFMTTVIR